MALAAAHFQTGSDPAERKGLLWLEGLEEQGEPAVPHIVAPAVSQRSIVTHYVPVNDDNAGKKNGKKASVFPEIGQTGLRRNRQGRTFARAWLVEDDTVYLVWPYSEPDPSTRKALEGLCAKVSRVGHSTSLVQMWLADEDEPGTVTWVPDNARPKIYLRLATPGTLAYLERQFNAEGVEDFLSLKVEIADATDKKLKRVARKRLREDYPDGAPPRHRPCLSVYQGYAAPLPEDTKPCAAAGTVFSPYLIALRLLPIDGPFHQLDLVSTLSMISRWREALLSQSNDFSETVRSVLSGHDADGRPLDAPHLALAPISFVGHAHADGHLLGLGAILPRDLSRDDRRDLLRALGRVHELKLGRLGVWELDPVTEARPPWNLRARAWTSYPDGALEWSTVTPVAFDRHPKGKGKAALRAEVSTMIKQCCVRIGMPRPKQVIVTSVSAHLGVPPSHAFPRLQRKDGSQRQHTHAILVFDKPVCGPVLLGAGRYRGYGFCRPLDGSGEGSTQL